MFGTTGLKWLNFLCVGLIQIILPPCESNFSSQSPPSTLNLESMYSLTSKMPYLWNCWSELAEILCVGSYSDCITTL